MRAIMYFANFGIHLLIWKQEKRHFCNDKTTLFASLIYVIISSWYKMTDLLRMLAKLNDGVEYSEKEIDNVTWQEKTKLVQKDPVTCSRCFDHQVQEFLNTVLKSKFTCDPLGKVKDFFYRVEFQQRGSPHIHMLVWIGNAPTLEKNSEEEIAKFVDKRNAIM